MTAHELILEEWIANLKNKNRSASAVEGNFDELFQALKQANATFDEARDLLPKAIKAHLPSPAIIRNTYKVRKIGGHSYDSSEKEFSDSWCKDITDKGTNSMYSFFPRPKTPDEQENEEPKVYGNMSVREYKAQRRYADQFPTLNTIELEKRIQAGTYNPMEDLAALLDKKKDNDGDSK